MRGRAALAAWQLLARGGRAESEGVGPGWEPIKIPPPTHTHHTPRSPGKRGAATARGALR